MPLPALLAAGLPFLGNALSGIFGASAASEQARINANVARENNERTIQANKDMAEYQYSKDLEMWNKGNEYNTPEAQMGRLSSAGLNPNLVYGSGSAAGNTAGQLPKYNAPTVEYKNIPSVDLPGMLAAYQDFQLKSAQIDNLRAHKKATLQSTANADLTGQILQNKEMMSRTDRDYRPDVAFQQLEKLRQGNEMMRMSIPYQAQILQGKNRLQQVTASKIVQDTDLQRLKTDWFVTQMFGDLFGKATSGLTKMLPGSRVRGVLSPGTLSKAKKWDTFEKNWNKY